MRKAIFGCLGAAAVAFALQFTPANVQAQGLFSRFCDPCDAVGFCDPCDRIGNGSCFDNLACDPCGALDNCGPKMGKWFLNGHIEAGFFANGHGQKSTYATPWGTVGRGANDASGNTALLQNTRLTGAQVNQIYLSMGRSVDGRRGLDIGGTVDFTWGSDAYIVQARGMEFGAGHGGPDTEGRWGKGDYYAAIAQAYVEVAYDRWNVKAGKLYAPFGIDSYKSTENFFYSWSPTMLSSPTMGGGVLASYVASNQLILLGGWIMPEEVGESSKNDFIAGGFIVMPTQKLNVRYVFAAGENTYAGNGLTPYDLYVHSLTTTYHISKRLTNVLDWTYVQVRGDGPKVGPGNLYSYALMNQLTYQYNKQWAFGTRFGVLNNNGFGIGPAFDFQELDWYTVSLGANWTPNKWLTIKPEVRYDWTDGKGFTAAPFNATRAGSTYQFSGGMSAVVKF